MKNNGRNEGQQNNTGYNPVFFKIEPQKFNFKMKFGEQV